MIRKGKDRGKTGKVLRAIPKNGTVLVEGINLFKKHQRSRREEGKGEVIQKPMPLRVTNVGVHCSSCGKAVRTRMKLVGIKKVRVCVTCGKEF